MRCDLINISIQRSLPPCYAEPIHVNITQWVSMSRGDGVHLAKILAPTLITNEYILGCLAQYLHFFLGIGLLKLLELIMTHDHENTFSAIKTFLESRLINHPLFCVLMLHAKTQFITPVDNADSALQI